MNKKKDASDLDIVALYNKEHLSTYELAEHFDTYPNKIRRILKKNGVDLRTKSDAQKNALKKGRTPHPTKGTKRSEDTKLKISEAQGRVWDGLTDQEKKKRSEIGKAAWEQKSDAEKEEFMNKAHSAIRDSSRRGSKLERFLFEEMLGHGFRVEFHKERWLRNQRLQVDIFLPDLGAAIEIDGPSHFKPVWGQENLAKTKQSDLQKSGLILNSGLILIRIQQQKKISQRYKREVAEKLFTLLEKIQEKYPKENERYFEL